jgi:hypothetical protein
MLVYSLDSCPPCSYNAIHNSNRNREETLAEVAKLSAEGANPGLASPDETLRQKGPCCIFLWKVSTEISSARDTDGAILQQWSTHLKNKQAIAQENLSGPLQRVHIPSTCALF